MNIAKRVFGNNVCRGDVRLKHTVDISKLQDFGDHVEQYIATSHLYTFHMIEDVIKKLDMLQEKNNRVEVKLEMLNRKLNEKLDKIMEMIDANSKE
jgi:hypothetical protein